MASEIEIESKVNSDLEMELAFSDGYPKWMVVTGLVCPEELKEPFDEPLPAFEKIFRRDTHRLSVLSFRRYS